MKKYNSSETSDSLHAFYEQTSLKNKEEEVFSTQSGTENDDNYHYVLPDKLNILKSSILKSDKIENENVKSQAKKFLKEFERILWLNKTALDCIGALPKTSLHQLEDKSALLEWGVKDFKIGFSFETDPEESSWYVVTNNNLNEISGSGLIQDEPLPVLITKAIQFVAVNT